MSKPFTLYGWHLSYFTGKVRCYLAYKNIPFIERNVNLYDLTVRLKRKTGVVVMPILQTPENTWLQDTSVIIDQLEARYPQAPVIPETPVQRFVSYLLEAWSDEWWVPIAMHTRWSHPENYQLFEQEAGQALLPHFPGFMQRRAVAKIAGQLRGKLHAVGVRPQQFALMDSWAEHMLDLLEQHFAAQPYLLGGHPTLGDFALAGTMYGHLGRDPWPARELIAPRPHLRSWIDRMANPPASGDRPPLLSDDQIADTLLPILQLIFAEFVPMLEGTLREVNQLLPNYPAGKALPRGLNEIEMPMGNGSFRRNALPYSLWMAQRVLDCYQTLPTAEQHKVSEWVRQQGGANLLELKLPRLHLAGLRVAVE